MCVDIEDITRGREDMNFIFEWQNKILLNRCARSYNIVLPLENKIHNFKPLCNVLLLYRQKDVDKIIDFYSPKSNCDTSNLQCAAI